VNNKFARIKTNSSGSIEAKSQQCVERLRNQRKTSVMVSSVEAETRTGHLSETSLQLYLFCRFGEVRYRNISNVFLTVHHSIDFFQVTNLMHTSFIFFLLVLQPPSEVVFYSPLVGFSLLAYEDF